MRCTECSKQVEQHFSNPVQTNMNTRHLCFHCLFWTEYVDLIDNPTHLRIEHNHYVVGKETESVFGGRGFGGRRFTIKRNDGTLVTTTNLWHQGQIPVHFQERLPDNAVWVKE